MDIFKKEKLLSMLSLLINQNINIQQELSYGIIDNTSAVTELNMIKSKERKIKKELLAEVHIAKNGDQRKISYDESKKMWYTLLPQKKRIYASTEDGLLDKLMVYYQLSSPDYTISHIFELAIQNKEQSESINPGTIVGIKCDYSRFIDESFAMLDIRNITCDDLSIYSLKMVRNNRKIDSSGNEIRLKKKAFLRYKGLLNLIFSYAKKKKIIFENPLDDFNNSKFLKECDCKKKLSEKKIFSIREIEIIKKEVKLRMKDERYEGYFINGYAILFSILTGARAGEIPSLKWEDIGSNYIHFHSQQLAYAQKGGKQYYFVDWTKNEKGIPNGGRKFPLSNEIKELLSELKLTQYKFNIHSEYIFCNRNGEWIKTDAYETCLRRLLKSLGFSITNNHAFRMSLNSNILAEKFNLSPAKRAELLGHSIETNLKYYTYPEKDDMDDLVGLFNEKVSKINEVAPRSHHLGVI